MSRLTTPRSGMWAAQRMLMFVSRTRQRALALLR